MADKPSTSDVIIGLIGLTAAIVFIILMWPQSAIPKDPFDLGGRHIVAVEGYGARCIVLYNENGMAAAGSGALNCKWYILGSGYEGDWRLVQPK